MTSTSWAASDLWRINGNSIVLQQALFPGDSELQQLLHIFGLLGTPDETTWPVVTKLRDWHEFPHWRPTDFSTVPGGP
jgi:cyclin-dependent kinase